MRPDSTDAEDADSTAEAEDLRPDLVAVGDDHEPTKSRRERRARREATARAAREQARTAGRSLSVLTAKVAGSRRGMARQTANENRLRTELTVFARELTELTERNKAQGASWAAAADGLLADAAQALVSGEQTESWHLVRAAKRQAYDGRNRDELAVERAAILADARRELAPDAAEQIAADLAALPDTARLEKVRIRMAGARRQIDDQAIARFEQLRLAARSMVNTGVMLTLVLVGGAVAAWLATSLAEEGEALRNLDNYVSIAALGAMGVTLSLFLPWRRVARRPAVLDFFNPIDVTLLRLVLGVGAALAVVTILQSDLQAGLDLAGVKAYPWAIAAGFSERLLDRRLLAIDDEARGGDATGQD